MMRAMDLSDPRSLTWLALACTLGCAAPAARTTPAPSTTEPRFDGRLPASLLQDEKAVARSASVLMPEWEPDSLSVLGPLGPDVVAWGTDPVHASDDELARRARTYRELGVRHLAVNTWMLTATADVLRREPRYVDASCVDVTGERIVPSWLEGPGDGVKDYWGCTNHPLFRELLREQVRRGIASGADMLHLDDHLGSAAAADFAGGCFCAHCLEGFRGWLARHHDGAELRALGIDDVASFDYRAYVRAAGIALRSDYLARKHELSLYPLFLRFQRAAVAGLVAELKALAAEVAGEAVPLGLNAYNLSPTQLANTHLADYFANEVEHRGQEDLVPPFVFKLGDALGRPVFATASGGDWAAVAKRSEVTRVRHWIATAYAFGHHFMYAYKKWAFDEQAGTIWYDTPLATYEPLVSFAHARRALLDGYEPVAQLALVYENAAALAEDWSIREAARSLHDRNVPFALVAAGDELLQHALSGDDFAAFERVVMLEPSRLEGPQARVVEQLRAEGRAVSFAEIEARVQPWLRVEGTERVWLLPRRAGAGDDAPLVVHALNRAYDEGGDRMLARGPFRVVVARALLGARRGRVVLHAPLAGSQAVVTRSDDAGLTIEVPGLEQWAILEIR
jgi:hypothetical protein